MSTPAAAAPIPGATGWQFEYNGTYAGHDEPSVKFISGAPGTGHNMTDVMRLAKGPKGKRPFSLNGSRSATRGTQSGRSGTDPEGRPG
jgi:hypothetical protein